MLQAYHDITSRLGEPLWWDEAGVPRYDIFCPGLCNNIYAHEAILLLIMCQWCGRAFHVAITDNWIEDYKLKEAIQDKSIHYGDPPIHGCVGDSMNCDDTKVIEYWIRESGTFDWERDTTLEISVEDTDAETDRVRRDAGC